MICAFDAKHVGWAYQYEHICVAYITLMWKLTAGFDWLIKQPGKFVRGMSHDQQNVKAPSLADT